jgi:hypothetical protein
MSEKSFGVSIDGDRVTVVELLGDVVVSATPVSAGSMQDSLSAALAVVKQRRSDPAVRIALVAPSATLRRIDVTAKVASSRADFEDAAHAALPVNRETTAFSGAFFDPEAMLGDAVTPGVAMIAPKTLVEDVYAALGKLRAEVVASPLALTGPDGIWIGIHQSVAEVTLFDAGRPVAYRQLRIGGLSGLVPVLGDPSDPQFGQRRLIGSLTGTGPDDPGARIEISRYMRMLTGEVGQTLDYWRRSGEPVPASPAVMLYGLGACSAAAATALSEAGLVADMPEEFLSRLSYVPLGQRPEAVLGFAAGLSVGRYMPQAAFVNPVVERLAGSRQKNRKRLVGAGIAALVVVLGGLFVGRPVYQGWSAKRDADRELAAARSEFDGKAGVYAQTVDLDARVAVITAARTGEPDWSSIYADLLASLPQGADVSQVSTDLEEGVVSVSMSASLPGGDYDDLTAWLDRLAALPGALDAWSTGFSQEQTGASFVVTVRIQRVVDTETAIGGAATTTPTTTPVATTDTAVDSTTGATVTTDPAAGEEVSSETTVPEETSTKGSTPTTVPAPNQEDQP